MVEKMLMRNNRAQLMVLEAVLSATLVILSIIFAISLSPPPSYTISSTPSELRSLATDSLSALEHKEEVTGYQNYLVRCIVENDLDFILYYLNLSLPTSTYYNIYISNLTTTVMWFNGEKICGGKFGSVERIHRLFYYDGDITVNGTTLKGNIYEFILEVWRV